MMRRLWPVGTRPSPGGSLISVHRYAYGLSAAGVACRASHTPPAQSVCNRCTVRCNNCFSASSGLQGSDQIRQAFSKRKKGLVLKAYQLNSLTDAKVRGVDRVGLSPYATPTDSQ